MKWNYIFASCLMAALLLDQTSALRPLGSRSRSATRSTTRSSYGRSGSAGSYRPPSTQVTHYDPANSHFSPRPRTPSPGPSTSSAGSSRRPSHLPLSHSSSTSSGYFSSNSLHSPHHSSTPGASSSASSPINPFQRLQYIGNQRHTSPAIPSTSGHQSPPTSGHNSRSSSPSRSAPANPAPAPTQQNFAAQSYDPQTRYNMRQLLQNDAVAIPTHPVTGLVRRRQVPDFHTPNDLSSLPVQPSAIKAFVAAHKKAISSDRSLTSNEKRQKIQQLKDLHQRMKNPRPPTQSSNNQQNPVPGGHNPNLPGPSGQHPQAAGPSGQRPQAAGPSGQHQPAAGPSGQHPQVAGPSNQHPNPGVPATRRSLDDFTPKQQKKIACGKPGSTPQSCYDYYAFSMFWSPTNIHSSYTRRATAMPREDKWTIHGLWPNKKGITTAPPKDCDVKNKPFDVSKLHSIRHSLDSEWFSASSDNEHFWQHEWDKHGKCAARSIFINDIEGYFRKGLSLANTYRFGEVLNQAGFVPGSTMTLQQIYDTITQHYSTPEIITWRDVATDITYLSEIRVCLDHRFKHMNCPVRPPNPTALAQDISYLSITSVP